MDKPISLSFIQQDVNQQLVIARDLLAAARRLRALKEASKPDPAEIEAIERLLVTTTDTLVENATKTGRTVAELIGGRR